MTILITGGFGYIGGRLAQHLGNIHGDANIRLLVRNGSHVPDWVGKKQVVTGDLLDIHSLESACEDVDAVIHLAALNEIDSARDPLAALRVNGEGTLNLINAAIMNNVKKMIYFSTFHVYGLNASGNISETTVPLPVHPYAITHHVSEDFVRMVNQKQEIKGIILRLSNGFGCPAHSQVNRWSLVVNDLCLQAVINNKMVLKSSGKQHRDFITLTDVSRCVEHLLFTDYQNIDAADCIYNLGGEFSHSILDMAELIKERCEKTLGISPEITIGKDNIPNNNVAEPVRYNIDKIKKTGFELIANVNEEIDKTILFCEQHKDLLKCNLQ